MSHAYFLTGTDTEVGKTFATCALINRASRSGLRAVGLKPIAAGTDAHGVNDDVARIKAANTVELPERIINPYCFSAPIAPHIAAAHAGINIDFDKIGDTVTQAEQVADFVIVEGAGGFRIPLGVDRDSADLAVALALPVILVVGVRLGCLNHALLTAEAILSRGLKIAGWIANRIDPAMPHAEENIWTLAELLAAPLLGCLPYCADGNPAAAALALELPA